MDCPRCGGSLSQYRLGDAETVACDDCIYVGVAVDHTSEPGHRESWTEALDRFYQQHSEEQVEELLDHEDITVPADVKPIFERPAEADGDAADGDDSSGKQSAEPGN
jgi:hypothetical protein